MDKAYIKDLVQSILDKEFKSIGRRTIKEYDDRLNICCPYCGDGKSEYKKRGNIYFNRLMYICFNCDKKTTLDVFCKDYNELIDPDKKMEMIEHLNNNITISDFEDEYIDTRIDDLIELSELERVFKQGLTPISDFSVIKKNGGIYKYLVNRGITDAYQKNIFQGKYWRNENEFEWVIIMINRKDDKVLGIQVRNLKEGKRRMFKIYNFETILEWVNIGKETPKEFDINKLVIYNKLSYYFNILNIDLMKDITVFEGYIDSLFFPNSIGLVGVNTDYRFLESNDLSIRYFFDNDDAGFTKSSQKIKLGYRIFLWKKLFNDIVNKKNSSDPYTLYNRVSKVKDLNKLNQLVNNSYEELNLERYFSVDIYDLRWIPKVSKRKRNNDIDYNWRLDNFNKIIG